MNRLLPIALAAALAAPATAAAETIAADPNARLVTALDGTIVWATGSDEQTLMQRSPDGTIAPVKGAPKAAAYRALDLGRDASNRLVLTYSRCSTLTRCTALRDDLEGRRSSFKGWAPKNCTLSTPPALWRDRAVYGLACFKRSGGRRVSDTARSGLYVRTNGKAKRLSTPSLAAKAGARDVEQVDVRGRNVAAVYADIAAFATLRAASGSPATTIRAGASEGDTEQRAAGLALATTTLMFALTQSTYPGEPAQAIINRQSANCHDWQRLTATGTGDLEFAHPASDVAADGRALYLAVPGTGIVAHEFRPDVGC